MELVVDWGRWLGGIGVTLGVLAIVGMVCWMVYDLVLNNGWKPVLFWAVIIVMFVLSVGLISGGVRIG